MKLEDIKEFQLRHYSLNGVEWVELTIVLRDGSSAVVVNTENDADLIRVVLQDKEDRDARAN